MLPNQKPNAISRMQCQNVHPLNEFRGMKRKINIKILKSKTWLKFKNEKCQTVE